MLNISTSRGRWHLRRYTTRAVRASSAIETDTDTDPDFDTDFCSASVLSHPEERRWKVLKISRRTRCGNNFGMGPKGAFLSFGQSRKWSFWNQGSVLLRLEMTPSPLSVDLIYETNSFEISGSEKPDIKFFMHAIPTSFYLSSTFIWATV